MITFKRILGLAAVYGVFRYIRANGGPEQAFSALKEKAQGLFNSTSTPQKHVDTSFATNVGMSPRTSVGGDKLH